MQMISYLLETDDYKIAENEISKITDKTGFKSATKSVYDIEETSIDNALEDLDTYSFLNNQKIIIIKNIEMLDIEKNKDSIEHLYKYLNNPMDDNLLIIHARKLNNTTKLTKELKRLCKYVEININPKNYINELLKGYKYNQQVINLIDEYSQGDITKIDNECKKLMSYKYDTKEISTEDVEEIVVKKLGDPKDLTFSLVRSIGEKDKKRSLERFHELLDYNIEPYSLIGLLASQIRIIYQVKLLTKNRMTDKEIATTLDEKSDYRIKKTRELIPLYTDKELLRLMQMLSNIDLKLKTTDVSPLSEIEQFIINLD